MRLKLSPQRTVEKLRQTSSVDEMNHGSDSLGVEIFDLQGSLLILDVVAGQKHLPQNVRFGRHNVFVAVEGVRAAEDLEVGEGVVCQERLRSRQRTFGIRLEGGANSFGMEDCKLEADVEAAVRQE